MTPIETVVPDLLVGTYAPVKAISALEINKICRLTMKKIYQTLICPQSEVAVGFNVVCPYIHSKTRGL